MQTPRKEMKRGTRVFYISSSNYMSNYTILGIGALTREPRQWSATCWDYSIAGLDYYVFERHPNFPQDYATLAKPLHFALLGEKE